MSASSLAISAETNRTAKADPKERGAGSEGWVYLLLGLLTAGAWWISSLQLFTSDSRLGYWLGVAGGVTMLGVFAYPMRKHLRFMQRWGAAKYWFFVHMTVGVAGPALILVHSTFKIGSINAGVALFSMVIVALSGVVGRFLYVRVHRDLHGGKLSLDELRQSVAGGEAKVAKLRFAPKVQEALLAFEKRGSVEDRNMWHVVVTGPGLAWRHWRTERFCHTELRIRLAAVARSEGWSRRDFRRRLRASRALVSDYLRTVHRLVQFAALERMFSLWHVVHVPFVYLMVLSAVAHVVAVHAY